MRDYLRRRRIQRDLPAQPEMRQVYDTDGAAALVRNEAISAKSGRLAASARRGRGCDRQCQQIAPRELTIHSAIVMRGPKSDRRAAHAILWKAPTMTCEPKARALSRAGEMAEWLKAHAWKACIGET